MHLLRARLSRLVRQPWSVLLPLVLAQWLFLLLLSRHTDHNGWLFSQTGEETTFYATAWSLAHGHIPAASIGYGWSLLTAPIAAIVGPNLLNGLPGLLLVQTVVLLPVALLAVYGIASRIGGRLLGYFTAASWVVVPYVTIRLFVPDYRETYVQKFLPQALGLTALGDFPSLVCLLVAAYFAVVSIEKGASTHAAVAGLFAGFGIGIDPANALFLAAPALGYTLARRAQAALAFGLVLLPAAAALVVWKYRAVGQVPFHLDVDLHQLQRMKVDFRDVFYSDRLVEVPFIAGVIAIGRRSWAKGAFVAAWFLSFVLVKGSASDASIDTGSFFRLIMPAFPAFVIACCSIPLLVPRLGPRLADAFAAQRRSWLDPRDRRVLAGLVVLATVPLIAVAALRLQTKPTIMTYADNGLIPVDEGLRPQARVAPGELVLAWSTGKPNGARVIYQIFRNRGSDRPACRAGQGAARCTLGMRLLGRTDQPIYGGSGFPPGRWSYRVGIEANSTGDSATGHLIVLSAAVNVTVP